MLQYYEVKSSLFYSFFFFLFVHSSKCHHEAEQQYKIRYPTTFENFILMRNEIWNNLKNVAIINIYGVYHNITKKNTDTN